METLDTTFAQMVKEHKIPFIRYVLCFRKIPMRSVTCFGSAHQPMERVQFVRAPQQYGYVDMEGQFNTCISYERKKKKRAALPLVMDINLFEDKDEDARQIRRLYDRIHRLKPFDRAIVLLWLENISYEEIGEIVGISAKNVSVRLYRIKEELKKMSNH